MARRSRAGGIDTFVQEHMSDESMGVNLAVRKKLYKTSDADYLTEEIVADAFGTMLEKSDVLEQFVTEHRSAAQKILDALHDLLLKIRRALGSKEVTLSDNQRAAFRDLAGKTQKMEKLFADALETMQGKENAATKGGEVKLKQQELTDSDVRFSLKGINKLGIEVYETSKAVMRMPVSERKKEYIRLMNNEYAGRTARLVRNGHTYYAEFDKKDLSKPMFGDNRSSKEGKSALVRAVADGDIFDLVSLYYEIGDCYFAQIVRIRDLKMRGKLTDKSDKEFYRKNKDAVDIKRHYSEAEQDIIANWT